MTPPSHRAWPTTADVRRPAPRRRRARGAARRGAVRGNRFRRSRGRSSWGQSRTNRAAALPQPMVAVRLMVMGLVLDVGEEAGEALNHVPVVRPDVGEVAQVVGDLRELHVLGTPL